ncbi:hypothetical protein ACFOG5_05030 [Pedobacter fastidiosus]|uniref:hypothetical protein n=1 Tax=Pedobacter fastidiosus TaxID=2765361 RepID=UPI00361F10FE
MFRYIYNSTAFIDFPLKKALKRKQIPIFGVPNLLNKKNEMEQGRSKAQIDSNNKMMATFLIAIFVFVVFAFLVSFIKTKNPFILEMQAQVALIKK